jgi:NADH-quinone oxidoreductase subunit A
MIVEAANTPFTTSSLTGDVVALWPVILYFAAVLAVVAGMLGISFVLGQRHWERATGLPYESGINATGSARGRVASDFFRIAIFFVVFDLESVFIFAWATSVRALGWAGYIEILVFTAVLLAALVYLWREKAFELGDGS